LKKIKNTSTNPYSRAKVEKKLALLKDETWTYKEITREQFLKKVHSYLVLGTQWKTNNQINYRDLEDEQNTMANAIFTQDTTWKDRFWKNYFQPKQTLSRGEAAYVLSTILNQNDQPYLTRK
jgi:hypothetical protein